MVAEIEYDQRRPCGDCTRPSNNMHFDCPPRMNDGRAFTDYGPRCDINFVRGLDFSTMDSYEYRQFLMTNADDILAKIRGEAYDTMKCGPCMEPFMTGTMAEEKERDVCNARTCTRERVGCGNGIGLGRWYGHDANPDYEAFKRREQASMRDGANCCGTRDDNASYFPPDGIVPDDSINRYASVGGGKPLTGGDLIIPRPSS